MNMKKMYVRLIAMMLPTLLCMGFVDFSGPGETVTQVAAALQAGNASEVAKNFNAMVDLTLPDNGFIRGDKLENFINKSVRQTPLERLKIPLRAVATNLQTGEEIIFATGNTGRAVRASCSIPGIFQPVRIGDKAYVDGGVVSPVAVEAARRAGADVVIAVDISAGVAGSVPQGILDTILQSIDIMYAKIATAQLRNADVVIRPKVSHIGSSDFEKRNEAILEGEKAATQALPQIRQILNKLRQEGRLP